MKEQNWDDSIDAPKEIFDPANLLAEEGDEAEVRSTQSSKKARVTEMRRRIEERLDSKRISLEFDYDELENWSENLQ